MKIIFAQGNPGLEYKNTRHSVGFLTLDALAKAHQTAWIEKKAFRAQIATIVINNEKIILVKPTTFYNLTGMSIQAINNYYKLNTRQDILIIHDDLALDFGVLKTRTSGSAGGNKGLQSIIKQLGVNFCRIRIGINNEKSDLMSKSDFVLSKFNKEELTLVPSIINQSQLLIQKFILGGFENSTYKLTKKRK